MRSEGPGRRRRSWSAIATLAVASWLLLIAGCGGDADPVAAPTGGSEATAPSGEGTTPLPPATTSPGTSSPGAVAPSSARLYDGACAGDLSVAPTGTVAAGAGSELSGIVASRAQPGVLWVHDDSGAGPQVYAIADDGSLLATYELDAEAVDWEDIAIGRAPGAEGWSLYLADIGDNAAAREAVVVYRIAEPVVAAAGAAAVGPDEVQPVTDVEALTLTYPDRPHNAEAILIDPDTGQLVIVTKEEDGAAQVFVADGGDLVDGSATELTLAGTADFGRGGLGPLVTGADVAPDGTVIAVRTYAGVHLFARAEDESVAQALAGSACEGPPVIELQGESVAISADGQSYLTVSEGVEPELHRTS